MMASLKLAPQSASQPATESWLAFVADDVTREMVDSVLSQQDGVHATVESGGIVAALRMLRPDAAPALLIIDISGAIDAASDIAALMAVVDAHTRVIALGTDNDVGLFRNLLAVGVADYLVKPLDGRALRNAITNAMRSHEPQDGAVKRGQVMVFFGTRGGLGTTTAAVNTAWIIAREQGKRVGLIDLDLHFGTVALNLALEPGGGLREALEAPDRIDGLFIERAMTKHNDRLFVLSAEESLGGTLMFDPASLRVLLPALQEKFDVLIVDLPRGVGALQRHVLAAANKIVVVSEPSLAGARDAYRVKALLKEIAGATSVVYVGSGAHDSKHNRVTPADFQQTVGEKLALTIPFDNKAIALASGAGKPLAEVSRSSETVKQLRRLATELVGQAARPKSFAFWRR